MRRPARHFLTRVLALVLTMSITCSYSYAASFGDLQDAIDGVTVKPETSAFDSASNDSTAGSNDSTAQETNDSTPQEPSDSTPQGPSDSTPQDPTGSTPQDPTDSTPQEPSGSTPQDPTDSAPQDPADGMKPNSDPNPGTDADDGADKNVDPEDEPPAEADLPEENQEAAPAPAPAPADPPKNGSLIAGSENHYGYGWTKDDSDNNWKPHIEAWDDDDGNRHIQLNGDVSYDSEKDGTSTSILIGGTDDGKKVYLDLNGFTITGQKDSSVIEVGTNSSSGMKGGHLVLDDSSEGGTGKITGGSTGVATWGQEGTFEMNGGTITGNSGGVGGGVINRGQFTMNGGKITGNTVSGNGGGVYVNEAGQFTMNGGEISNNTAQNGGGVYVNANPQMNTGGRFTMKGGEISGNKSSLEVGNYEATGDPTGQGGGVYVAGGATFILGITDENGKPIAYVDKDGKVVVPLIENNEAGEGGGVFVADGGVFTMNKGTVNANIAHYGEGGGIYIRGEGTIQSGSITNNKTYTVNDLGGGGIYIENSGKLTLYNAIITENKSGGLGAGLAACVHGKTVVYVKDGAAIFGNSATVTESGSKTDKNGNPIETATSAGHNGNGEKIDGHDLWQNNQDFKDGAQDIFTASDSKVGDWSADAYGRPGIIIGPQMLGGGDADWTGWMFAYDEKGNLEYKDGKPVCVQVTKDNNGNIIYADRLLGVTAGVGPDSETVKAAQAAAAAAGGGVLISGNYSSTHGGGIANNGLLVIGKDVLQENPPEDVEGKKTLTKDDNAPAATPDRDLKDQEFTFVLKDKDGNVVAKGTNTAKGDISISFPTGYFYDKQEGEYTFTVTEVNTGDSNVIYDGTEYRVKVIITEEKKTVEKGGVTIIEGIERKAEVIIMKADGVEANGDTHWVEMGTDESMTFQNRYTSVEEPKPPEDPKDPPEDPKDPPEDPKDPPEAPPKTPDDPKTPEEPLPDPEVPLEELPEPEVPLAEVPEEEEELPEDEVPLAEVPETGDISLLWYCAGLLSACGLLGMRMFRKREDAES